MQTKIARIYMYVHFMGVFHYKELINHTSQENHSQVPDFNMSYFPVLPYEQVQMYLSDSFIDD